MRLLVLPPHNGVTEIRFWCSPCAHLSPTGGLHAVSVPAWRWNGDLDRPTIRPSVLTRRGDERCHLFVTDGQIEYLADSSHDAAGFTLDLGDLPAWSLER